MRPASDSVKREIVPVANQRAHEKKLSSAGLGIAAGHGKCPEIERGIEQCRVARLKFGEKRVQSSHAIVERTNAASGWLRDG